MPKILANGKSIYITDTTIWIGQGKISTPIELPEIIDNYVELSSRQILCINQHSASAYVVDIDECQLIKTVNLPRHPISNESLTIQAATLLDHDLIAYLSPCFDKLVLLNCTTETSYLHQLDLKPACEPLLPISPSISYRHLCGLPRNQMALITQNSSETKLIIYDVSPHQLNYITSWSLSAHDIQRISYSKDHQLLVYNQVSDQNYQIYAYDRQGNCLTIHLVHQDNLEDFINGQYSSLITSPHKSFTDLPFDSYLYILQWLDINSFITFLCINKTMHELTYSTAIWAALLEKNLTANLLITPIIQQVMIYFLSENTASLQILIDQKKLTYDLLTTNINDEVEHVSDASSLLDFARIFNKRTVNNFLYQKIVQPYFAKNQCDTLGNTLLMQALRLYQPATVFQSLITDIELLAENSNAENILWLAYLNKEISLVKKIISLINQVLKQYGDPFERLEYHIDFINLIFQEAIYHQDFDMINTIINGSDLRRLHYLISFGMAQAIESNNLPVVNYFLNSATNIKVTSKYLIYEKLTPVERAIRCGHLAIAQRLFPLSEQTAEDIKRCFYESIVYQQWQLAWWILPQFKVDHFIVHDAFFDRYNCPIHLKLASHSKMALDYRAANKFKFNGQNNNEITLEKKLFHYLMNHTLNPDPALEKLINDDQTDSSYNLKRKLLNLLKEREQQPVLAIQLKPK